MGFNYDFEESARKGASGVDKVIKYITANPKYQVIDVQDNEEMRKKDIDLIIIDKETNKEITVEVKTDSYFDRNFFFETVSNKSKNTDGCFLYTEADYVFYYFEKRNKLYKLPTKKVRKWFMDNMEKLDDGGTGTLGQWDYKSKGKKVPVCVVTREFNLKPIII